MPTFSEQIVDDSGYRRPVGGALVYLLDDDGGLVTATSPNPVITDDFGTFSFTASDGAYFFEARIGGVTIARGDAIVGNPPQYIGLTGPSNNTRLSLTALKAASIGDGTSLYDQSLWTWTPGNFTGQADDINIVKANSTALTVGAWVRQSDAAVSTVPRLANGVRRTAAEVRSDQPISIKELGALGNDTAGDAPKMQSVIDAVHAAGGGTVFMPKGTYNLGNTGLNMRSGVSIVGDENRPTLRYTGAGAGVSMVALDPNRRGNCSIKNLLVTGSGATGFALAPANVADLSGVGVNIENIRVTGSWTDGFRFANMYGGSVKNLSTDQATIANACYTVLGSVNATNFDGLYTGDTAGHIYCLFADYAARADPGQYLPPGAGNTFTNFVAQGGKYGIYARCIYNTTFVAPYIENVARPIQIGDLGTARSTDVLIDTPLIIGGFANAFTGAEAIHVQNAYGVIVMTPDTKQWSRVATLTFTGGGGTGARGYGVAGRDGRIDHAVITFPGSGYGGQAGAPTVTDFGTGATYTASVDANGRVALVTVNTKGNAGALPADRYPAFLSVDDEAHVRIVAPYPSAGQGNSQSPIVETMLPMIGARYSYNTASSITIEGDMATGGAGLRLIKTTGGGRLHRASVYGSDGLEIAWVFPLPVIGPPPA